MRLFLAQHARRGLRVSVILVIASSLIGASLALAQAPASRMGHMPRSARLPDPGATSPGSGSAQQGHMPMERGAATLPSAGTVVRLHQHLVRVSIVTFAFKPARLVVSLGTRIVWTNKDSDPHTVASAKGLWASDALDTDEHFARTFNKVGTFAYYCAIHPFMHGVIIVTKSAARPARTAREVSR
jgi:plastocyanin